MRLSVFEGFMAAALLTLIVCFVVPRILQGSPEVRSSTATALALKLEALYSQWQNAGGLHGQGEPSRPALLTRNLLECFTSPFNHPYSSKPLSPHNLGPAGVYENPALEPNPATLRLKGFEHARLEEKTVASASSPGATLPSVILGREYAVYFDGAHWSAWPANP